MFFFLGWLPWLQDRLTCLDMLPRVHSHLYGAWTSYHQEWKGTARCASWNWFAIQAVPVGSDLLSRHLINLIAACWGLCGLALVLPSHWVSIQLICKISVVFLIYGPKILEKGPTKQTPWRHLSSEWQKLDLQKVSLWPSIWLFYRHHCFYLHNSSSSVVTWF